MSLLQVQGICAGYNGRQIIRDIAFSAEAGQVLGVLGCNGSGKTTLLKALCGVLPHQGECVLDGTRLESLSPRRLARQCSYIPQRSGITIDLSVLDVVLMGFNPQLGLLEQPGPKMKEKAMAALRQAGLAGREHESYLTLSEGQKQLCMLARTLAGEAKLLLLDEPESALDVRARHQSLKLLRACVKDGQRCAVVTLHDPNLALNFCDRLLVMAEGGISAVLSPAEETAERMEQVLSRIYGPVSIVSCADRSGSMHRVMLKEEEPSWSL